MTTTKARPTLAPTTAPSVRARTIGIEALARLAVTGHVRPGPAAAMARGMVHPGLTLDRIGIELRKLGGALRRVDEAGVKTLGRANDPDRAEVTRATDVLLYGPDVASARRTAAVR